MTEKMILDATCGDRTIWFQKNEPHTVYCDIRREEWEGDFGKDMRKKHRHLVINPDIQCSFTDLPFEDRAFNLVVFDPPHIENLTEQAWMRKVYGSLEGDWKPMIRKGFQECMRVLKPGVVLVFKWSDISISTRDILNVIGQEPLFGHRSGKKMNTHWMCFMKFEDEHQDIIESNVYDQEELIYPCTVQILRNSETGEVSWGWWEGEDPPIIPAEEGRVMEEICTDNRFKIIAEYKQKLVDGTNIETSPEEMAVIGSILFRFWQMGWLKKEVEE